MKESLHLAWIDLLFVREVYKYKFSPNRRFRTLANDKDNARNEQNYSNFDRTHASFFPLNLIDLIEY